MADTRSFLASLKPCLSSPECTYTTAPTNRVCRDALQSSMRDTKVRDRTPCAWAVGCTRVHVRGLGGCACASAALMHVRIQLCGQGVYGFIENLSKKLPLQPLQWWFGPSRDLSPLLAHRAPDICGSFPTT